MPGWPCSAMQVVVEVGGDAVCRGAAGGGQLVEHEEVVDESGFAAKGDLDAGFGQAPGVGLAFVAQRVVFGGDDERGWQPRQVQRAAG